MRASVIIPSFNASRTIEQCLSSLERQHRRDQVEVLVVDSSTDGTDGIIARRFPQVRLFHFTERMFPGAARNYAAARAQGDVLIFLDADCFVEPDWLDRVLLAHQDGYAAVGGALLNANPQAPLSVANHFFEFSAWLPLGKTREQREIPGGSMSLKRAAFAGCGPFPEKGYSEDSVLCWRMRDAGLRLLFEPSIRVFHDDYRSLAAALRVKSYHGRWFARRRSERLPSWRTILYALLSPGLAMLLCWRIWRRTRSDPAMRRAFWKSAPLIAALALSWAWGEFRGYSSRREPLP